MAFSNRQRMQDGLCDVVLAMLYRCFDIHPSGKARSNSRRKRATRPVLPFACPPAFLSAHQKAPAPQEY